MEPTTIQARLSNATTAIVQSSDPKTFDIFGHFLSQGCTEREAGLLTDYLLEACGRELMRDIGMILSETYKRRKKDGTWTEETRLDADPVWKVVEAFVTQMRSTNGDEEVFEVISQLSQQADRLRLMKESGADPAEMRGGISYSVFHEPLDE